MNLYDDDLPSTSLNLVILAFENMVVFRFKMP